MTRFILVRHGQSEANGKHLFAGNFDVELTSKGQLQAEKTAEYIAENFKVDKIYASDLKRAYNTAKAISDKVGVEINKTTDFREINAGEWEGKSYSFLEENYKEDYRRWRTDIGNAFCTGGESARGLGKRVTAALEKIAGENPDKTIAIATHATPIRATECVWKGLSFDFMKDIPWVSNASVTVVDFDKNGANFVQVGYDEHLGELRTHLPTKV